MKKLLQFVDWWNGKQDSFLFTADDFTFDDSVAFVGLEAETAFKKFLRGDNEEFTYPRISALGYPVIHQALCKVTKYRGYSSPSGRFPLIRGNFMEAVTLSALFQYGADVHSLHEKVHYQDVEGHIDCMVGDNAVLDVKWVSAPYFNEWNKCPTDDRGYITQALCYREALGVRDAYVLMGNAWFGQLQLFKLDDEGLNPPDSKVLEVTTDLYLEAATERLLILKEVVTLDDVFDYCTIPELVQDPLVSTKYGVLPGSLRYSQFKHCLYNLTHPEKFGCETAYEVYGADKAYDNVVKLLDKRGK